MLLHTYHLIKHQMILNKKDSKATLINTISEQLVPMIECDDGPNSSCLSVLSFFHVPSLFEAWNCRKSVKPRI